MHDDDDDLFHTHDDDSFDGATAVDIEGLERFTLRSVGVDIGSSTTHTIFSRLVLRREGAGLSAKFVVTERDVLHRSPIMLTPYLTATQIDTDKVKAFIDQTYRDAGLTPDDIDTGAVVVTGEAMKKENAQPILEYFAKETGRFVCASAGPMHEALLGSYGSGAVALSKAKGATVLNVDMGGGTAKLSVIQKGEVAQMLAVEIGARLIAYDDARAVTRVEQPAHTILRSLGRDVEVGDTLSVEAEETLATHMAGVLFEIIQGGEPSDLTRSLLLTPMFHDYGIDGVDYIVCSGGVSEYVYGRETKSFGDLGPTYGRLVKEGIDKLVKHGLLSGGTEGIRATVIGAGEYTLQASGTTSYISNAAPLPVSGVKVVRGHIYKEQSLDDIKRSLETALTKFDLSHLEDGYALALSVYGQPDYQYIRRVAEGVTSIADGNADTPLFLVLDVDVAKSLGGIIKEELKVPHDVLAIDGIEVGDLDFIDIGRPMGASEVIPVTVKSLIFGSKPAAHPDGHHH